MQAGVTRALPETLEASLRLAAESLEILGIGNDDTNILLRDVRQTDYDLLRDETQ
jgi:glutathione-regulated potassium-efflux system protein KefB